MRLIDADALLLSEVKRCGSIPTIGSGYYSEMSFKQVLNNAPTVDADPVVHGRWITITEKDTFGYTYKTKCSNCEFVDKHFCKSLYCPNCGANMDGGNEDG